MKTTKILCAASALLLLLPACGQATPAPAASETPASTDSLATAAFAPADYNYSKILQGDLSDFAGTYVNGEGKIFILNADGTPGYVISEQGIPYNAEAANFAPPKDSSLCYTWSVTFKDAAGNAYEGEAGFSVLLYPIGAQVWVNGEAGGERQYIPTDETKIRLFTGQEYGAYFPTDTLPDRMYYSAAYADLNGDEHVIPDGYTNIPNPRYSYQAPLPEDYAGKVVFPKEYSDEHTIIDVTHKASWEEVGVGQLFSILRYTPAEFEEEIIPHYGSGHILFAKDDEYYYVTLAPSDTPGGSNDKEYVRLCDEEDKVRADFMAANGLDPFDFPAWHLQYDLDFSDLADLEFLFASGVGAWATTLKIQPDGTFTGLYNGADMGDSGPGYPVGTRYWCSFSGKFSDLKRIGDYTYSMKCTSLEQEGTPGDVMFGDEDGGVKYVTSTPYGLDDADEMILYLPGKRADGLPEDFLWWVCAPRAILVEDLKVLDFWGLYNVGGKQGFGS